MKIVKNVIPKYTIEEDEMWVDPEDDGKTNFEAGTG
jgi:hypothetical protein